jgi:hypothetical protein
VAGGPVKQELGGMSPALRALGLLGIKPKHIVRSLDFPPFRIGARLR